jgi:hypothetical protein
LTSKLYKSNGKLTKGIKLHVKEKGAESQDETLYRFNGFNDRDFTFKYIRRLWTNASPYAGEDDSSEPSETEDNAPSGVGNAVAAPVAANISGAQSAGLPHRNTAKSYSSEEEKAGNGGDGEFEDALNVESDLPTNHRGTLGDKASFKSFR